MLTTTLLALLVAAAPAPPAEATVTEVIDGDTIEVETSGAGEQVRLIGIDSPEFGTCEAAAAAIRLTELLSADPVIVPGATNDRDRYDRILRYAHVAVNPAVDNDGTPDGMLDVGAALVAEGYAVARYDSRDGYGAHDREPTYIALDAASEPFVCDAAQLTLFETPPAPAPAAPAPAAPAPAPAPAPAAAPAGGCDPNYTGCVPIDSDVDCAGGSGNGPSYTGQVQVIGADVYGLDSDGDGVGCE